MKNKVFLRSAAVFFALFFLSACMGRSSKGENKNGRQSVMLHENNIYETTPSPVPETTYCVTLEGEHLRFYEISGNDKLLIKEIDFAAANYPKSDIDALKSGITAYSKEEGYEIIENFVN